LRIGNPSDCDHGGIELEEHFEVDRRQVVLIDRLGDLAALLHGDLPRLGVLQAVDEVGLLRVLRCLSWIEGAELYLGLERVDDLIGRGILGGCRHDLRAAQDDDGNGESDVMNCCRLHGGSPRLAEFLDTFRADPYSAQGEPHPNMTTESLTPLRQGRIAARPAAHRRRLCR
jgi:hypothetical protein